MVRWHMLRGCVVLTLIVAADSERPKIPEAKLLQGVQDAATLEAVIGKGAGADVGSAAAAYGVRKEEVEVIRDVMAVSQALQDELPQGPRVKLEIFTSAGCRECRKVFHGVIAKVLQKEGMLDIVDLKIVTWGDGDVVGEDGMSIDAAGILGLADASGATFSCALHGDPTCAGNAWEACLESKWPNAGDFFPVFNCIEGRACADNEVAPAQCFGSVPDVALNCASEFGEGIVNGDELKACAEGDAGKALLLANAQATAALNPTMAFLPWILVDGRAMGTGEDGKDGQLLLGKAICDAYAALGGEEPFACTKFPQTLDNIDDPWGYGEILAFSSPVSCPRTCMRIYIHTHIHA